MTPALLLLTLATAQAQDIPDARVTMPWNSFEELYRKGMAPEEVPAESPRDWSLNRAVYSGRVVEDDESVRFDAQLQVQVHAEERWVTVPLLPTTVGLERARIDGVDAPIFLNGGWYTLVTDRRGTFTVDLDFAASVVESDGRWTSAFGLAPSGGTEVTLEVPSDDALTFDIPRAQLVEDDQPRPGLRRARAVLPATANLSLSWTRAVDEEEVISGEPRLYAETHTLVGVGEGVLAGHSEVNWTIVNQGRETFTVELPADVAVLEVTGSGVREWDTTRSGDSQQITVQLNFEALGSYRLFVDYEQAMPEGSFDAEVPLLAVPGVERVKGYVGVEARSNLEITAGDTRGATRLDVRELPASVLGRTDQPVLMGFKVRHNDWAIPLEVDQHEDVDVLVTVADMAEATSMLTADGRKMGRVVWHVRNNRRQFLRLQMPEDSEIWSVQVAGRAAKPALDDKGRTLIPLVRSQAAGGSLAAFSVEVVWVEPGEAPGADGRGSASFALPRTDIPITYMKWSVYTPSDAKVKKRDITSTLRRVEWFNTPVTPEGEYLGGAVQEQQLRTAAAQNAAAETGVEPVEVAMPIEGVATNFEKLLVLDEPLEVSLSYKLKKSR